MKFIKKRWLGIPAVLLVAILVVALTAGGVFAFPPPPQTQTITQVVWAPVDSSVVVDPLAVTKPDLLINTMCSQNDVVIATVTVVVGTGDAGSYLHLDVDPATTSLYAYYDAGPPVSGGAYGVNLVSTAGNNPMNVDLTLSVNAMPGLNVGSHESLQLTAEGTYVFDETAGGMSGPNTGTANVVVTVTLEANP